MDRREFIRNAAAGSAVMSLGGLWWALDDERTDAVAGELRPDGRLVLPPGQRAVSRLRPMDGVPGSAKASEFLLRVHGEVDNPLELTLAELLALEQVDRRLDVHCVTGWSALGVMWRGVPIRVLAAMAGVRDSARHVIFEAPHYYTANVPMSEAMKPTCLVAHRAEGRPLRRSHGAPARALIPDRYFWKSAKWLTGIRFSTADAPGYWETRGYHNNADPWRQERHG